MQWIPFFRVIDEKILFFFPFLAPSCYTKNLTIKGVAAPSHLARNKASYAYALKSRERNKINIIT